MYSLATVSVRIIKYQQRAQNFIERSLSHSQNVLKRLETVAKNNIPNDTEELGQVSKPQQTL